MFFISLGKQHFFNLLDIYEILWKSEDSAPLPRLARLIRRSMCLPSIRDFPLGDRGDRSAVTYIHVLINTIVFD